MRVLTIFLAFAMLSACSTSPQEQKSAPSAKEPSGQPAHLSKGTYKFGGHCSRMSSLGIDLTKECGNYLGIIAKDPDRPLFIIALKDPQAAWQYQITSPGTMSEDGKVISYSVSSMMTLASSIEASRVISYPGACLFSTKQGEPLLHCTMWRDSTRHEITREVIFEGDGRWLFQRDTPTQ